MATAFVVGKSLLSEAQMLSRSSATAKAWGRSEHSIAVSKPAFGMLVAGVDLEEVAEKPAALGIGQPLSIEIRHIYTGKFPEQRFGHWPTDMLVSSGVKNLVDFPAAPRSMNFLRKVQAFAHPVQSAFESGTPVVFYTPSVTNLEIVVTVEMIFDNFSQEAFNQFGDLLEKAAGIPIVATASLYLLAGSVVAKLVGSIGEKLFDGSPAFHGDLHINFDPQLPQLTGPGQVVLTDDHMPIDLTEFEVSEENNKFFLVNKQTRKVYDGRAPYVVLRLSGESKPEYANFQSTLVSADLLNRFYHSGANGKDVAEDLIGGIQLVNDLRYRKKADEYKRAMDSAPADSAEYKKAKQMYDAYVKNIGEGLFKPAATPVVPAPVAPAPVPVGGGGN